MEELPAAVAMAVRLLARRDHSTSELEQKLTRRGVAPATVAAVVARLTDKGYLDDRRFARRWAEAAVEAGRGF
ncbi:MAG TPA: RecX family transcriptional regulator, partial [Geobacteraceae bacterium]